MTPAHSAPTVVLGALVQIDGAWRQNPAQRAFAGDAYIYVRAGELPAIDDAVADPLCKVKLFHPFTRFTYYAYALTEYLGADRCSPGLSPGSSRTKSVTPRCATSQNCESPTSRRSVTCTGTPHPSARCPQPHAPDSSSESRAAATAAPRLDGA